MNPPPYDKSKGAVNGDSLTAERRWSSCSCDRFACQHGMSTCPFTLATACCFPPKKLFLVPPREKHLFCSNGIPRPSRFPRAPRAGRGGASYSAQAENGELGHSAAQLMAAKVTELEAVECGWGGRLSRTKPTGVLGFRGARTRWFPGGGDRASTTIDLGWMVQVHYVDVVLEGLGYNPRSLLRGRHPAEPRSVNIGGLLHLLGFKKCLH